MAELLIILRRDPQTGKQNIVVKLESDPDALPIEHEQMHKTLVEKLVGKGLNLEDLGELVIERESVGQPTSTTSEPERAREKAGQGQ